MRFFFCVAVFSKNIQQIFSLFQRVIYFPAHKNTQKQQKHIMATILWKHLVWSLVLYFLFLLVWAAMRRTRRTPPMSGQMMKGRAWTQAATPMEGQTPFMKIQARAWESKRCMTMRAKSKMSSASKQVSASNRKCCVCALYLISLNTHFSAQFLKAIYHPGFNL